jgi:hypothetical protein
MNITTVKFTKVEDKRGKAVRGLWRRRNVFYVQLRVTNPNTGNPSVNLADSLAAALGVPLSEMINEAEDLRREQAAPKKKRI